MHVVLISWPPWLGTARARRAGLPKARARWGERRTRRRAAAPLDYAASWINEHVLKPRTEELYLGLLTNHLVPAFGKMDLSAICEADVRRWR